MRNKKHKNNMIIGGLLAIVLVMGIGYAAFSSKLSINGTGSVSSNFDVKITGITTKNIVGTAGNKTEPTYTDTTATFYTTLQSPGDSITYDITVANNGTLDAVLNAVKINTKEYSNAIRLETSGLSSGNNLLKGETKTLTVKVTYNSSVGSQPSETTETSELTLEFMQKNLDSHLNVVPVETTSFGGQKVEISTTGDGLHKDSTEEGSFYYSGEDQNNAIVFNGEPYRILRIEKDGRIKIIKMVSIGNMKWNTGGTNVWETSSLKQYLEETWLPTQESGEDYKYLTTNNEWYVGEVSGYNASSSSIRGAYAEEKKITVNSPVGLVSASEVSKSNYTGSTFLNCRRPWWTISPYNSTDTDEAFFGTDNGWGTGLWTHSVVGIDGLFFPEIEVFPVLYLKSSVSLTGAGTSTDPYCIAGSNCPKNLDFTQRAG